MIKVRRSSDRGFFDHRWLQTHHTFSFGEYIDLEHKHFRDLRVINEDRVAPGKGFDTHSHRDMEIISYVMEGTLSHKDSMGNGAAIPAGEVQYMSAGTGVTHSEYNHDANAWVHLMQIWIFPSVKGARPRYAQLQTKPHELKNQLKLVASPDGRANSIEIRQDAEMYVGRLDAGSTVHHAIRSGRGVWVQVVRGRVRCFDERLEAGDGAAIENEKSLDLLAEESAEFLLFDLK